MDKEPKKKFVKTSSSDDESDEDGLVIDCRRNYG